MPAAVLRAFMGSAALGCELIVGYLWLAGPINLSAIMALWWPPFVVRGPTARVAGIATILPDEQTLSWVDSRISSPVWIEPALAGYQ